MRKPPYSRQCEYCGARTLEGSALCARHKREYGLRWSTVIGKGGQAIGSSGDGHGARGDPVTSRGSVAHETPVSRPTLQDKVFDALDYWGHEYDPYEEEIV